MSPKSQGPAVFDPKGAFDPRDVEQPIQIPAPALAEINSSMYGLGVYAAIGKVAKVMAGEGIAKTRKNEQGGGYMFRGIDEVMNTLAPVLADAGLVILPRMLEREVTERATQRGGALFCTVLKAAFDFVCVSDGSRHTVVMYGEAFDAGDKSTNKAMSAAYKYAAFQTFCIPVAGTPDADEQTHEPVARDVATERAAPLPPPSSAPTGFEDWYDALVSAADTGTAAMAEVFQGPKDQDAPTLTRYINYRQHLGVAGKNQLKARAAAADAKAAAA